MSPSLKLGIYILLGVIAASFAIRLVLSLVSTLLHLLIPVVIVAGIGCVLYGLFSRKALGGGRRILP